MLRWLVTITPLLGAILFPLIVPLVMAHAGIGTGIILALLFSSLWFIAMLRTSELPH